MCSALRVFGGFLTAAGGLTSGGVAPPPVASPTFPPSITPSKLPPRRSPQGSLKHRLCHARRMNLEIPREGTLNPAFFSPKTGLTSKLAGSRWFHPKDRHYTPSTTLTQEATPRVPIQLVLLCSMLLSPGRHAALAMWSIYPHAVDYVDAYGDTHGFIDL